MLLNIKYRIVGIREIVHLIPFYISQFAIFIILHQMPPSLFNL